MLFFSSSDRTGPFSIHHPVLADDFDVVPVTGQTLVLDDGFANLPVSSRSPLLFFCWSAVSADLLASPLFIFVLSGCVVVSWAASSPAASTVAPRLRA